MTRSMRRREFVGLIGGAAAWPLAARAQQPAMPAIGYLGAGAPEASANRVVAFRKGLSEMGYVEGRNLVIEYRWASNDTDRLSESLADLVRRRVAVVVIPAYTAGTLAAKAATTTIPIVFTSGADPVQIGFVASLNRPGGNVTGIHSMNVELMPKRIGLLHELSPGATRFALLSETSSLNEGVRVAASTIGREIELLTAKTP